MIHRWRGETFVITDPSCFLDCRSLQDLISVLARLRKEKQWKNIRILIPTQLEEALQDLRSEQSSPEFIEVLRNWLPPVPLEQLELIAKGLINDKTYWDLFTKFESEHSPIKAENVEKEMKLDKRTKLKDFITLKEARNYDSL